jgi:hypothetical protein
MTVYLVFLRGREDNTLEAVYASREEAQAHANNLSAWWSGRWYGVVEEKIVIGA